MELPAMITRFSTWTITWAVVGLVAGGLLEGAANPANRGIALAIMTAAGVVVGAIGGAAHTIMRFVEDREKHEAFLQRTREGLTADHSKSK